MFQYTFLGTSASAPSIHRGLSSHILLYKEHRFLIDAGEGVQRQILRSGLGFRRIDKILITHGHLDHILGLAGLLSTFVRWETLETLELWAPPGAMQRIRDLILRVALPGKRHAESIDFREIEPGLLMHDDDFQLSAFRVSHRHADAFGFKFQEHARRPFLAEKAAQLGIPPGPQRGQLVRGNPITLPDGRTIQPEQVLGDPIPGATLVHVGDCGDTRSVFDHCQNADALVIEATYLHADHELAQSFGHLTARQAAQLARDTNVGQLYLTHISRRYHERDIIAEAQAIFPGAVVARDFTEFQISRRKKRSN